MVQLKEIIGGWKLVEDCWTSVDETAREEARVSSVMGVRLPLWMEGTVVPSVWSISPLRARFSSSLSR